jgi:hypothetical protein
MSHMGTVIIDQRMMEKSLPKPVMDRIGRFAREGRRLRALFGPEGYRLVATAMGHQPVVVVRAGGAEEFAGIRSAVLLEWARATGQTKQRKRPGQRTNQRLM